MSLNINIFLTHAHIDHSGLLPLLYARGFRGSVYATDATADLCSIMLRDSAHIHMQEAEWKNRKAKRSADSAQVEPLYTMEDADGIIRRLMPCEYDREIHCKRRNDNVTALVKRRLQYSDQFPNIIYRFLTMVSVTVCRLHNDILFIRWRMPTGLYGG